MPQASCIIADIRPPAPSASIRSALRRSRADPAGGRAPVEPGMPIRSRPGPGSRVGHHRAVDPALQMGRRPHPAASGIARQIARPMETGFAGPSSGLSRTSVGTSARSCDWPWRRPTFAPPSRCADLAWPAAFLRSIAASNADLVVSSGEPLGAPSAPAGPSSAPSAPAGPSRSRVVVCWPRRPEPGRGVGTGRGGAGAGDIRGTGGGLGILGAVRGLLVGHQCLPVVRRHISDGVVSRIHRHHRRPRPRGSTRLPDIPRSACHERLRRPDRRRSQ